MTHLTKILTFLLVITFSAGLYAQKVKGKSYATCAGEINLFKSKVYDIQFGGEKATSKIFSNYAALKGVSSSNQIWFSFIAPANGIIELNIKSKSSALNLLVFNANGEDLCTQVEKGNAEILRLIIPSKPSTSVGLDSSVSESFFAPVHIQEGKVLNFCVIGPPSSTETVVVDLDFKPDDVEFNEYGTKAMSFRNDDFTQELRIAFRDKATNKPLIPTIKLYGMKTYEGIYTASDVAFDITRNGKLSIKSTLEGYFDVDTVGIPISFNQSKEIVIEMDPIRSGKSFQIEQIEFEPGTSKVLEKSIPKLKRLRDFLLLNAMVSIEIQGHVFEMGQENGLDAKKMSEARAKRVMKYLTDNGINKKRMTAVGFGSSQPIYPMPRNFGEEQANRRVEVIIK